MISAPAHLRPDTAAWWESVASDYALEAHLLRILSLAAEAWDRGQEAREAIAKHGPVYVDRFDQPRARPEVAIERDSRISFARLVRELALDLDPPDEPGRPPRLGDANRKITPAIEWDEEDRRILGLN
jgi:phage terminase small subunit